LKRKFKFQIFVQHFNSSAFLSRKRVQKYCFKTFPPNIQGTFFMLSCNFSAKSLIYKCVVQHGVRDPVIRLEYPYTLLYNIRARKKISGRKKQCPDEPDIPTDGGIDRPPKNVVRRHCIRLPNKHSTTSPYIFSRTPTRFYIPSLEMYIPSLEMYIPKLETYIPKLEIYIPRLEI